MENLPKNKAQRISSPRRGGTGIHFLEPFSGKNEKDKYLNGVILFCTWWNIKMFEKVTCFFLVVSALAKTRTLSKVFSGTGLHHYQF